MSYYPPYRSSSNNIKVELDLSNYATKDDVKKVEDKVDENERVLSFNRGFFFYLQKNHCVYECKSSSFDITIPANTTINIKINTWKSTGIFSSSSINMIAVKNGSGDLPKLGVVNDYYVNLSGNHFQQNKINVCNICNHVVTNIYCVYKLDPISSVQNALFGSIKLLKMLILVSINIKDMVFVLMKVVHLAKVILQMVEMF